MVIGAKRFETRSWATKYRGPLLIHAAKSFPTDCRTLMFQQPFFNALKDKLPDSRGVGAGDVLPRGAIIGRVDLVDCVPTDAWLDARLREYGRINFLVQSGVDGDKYLTSEDHREYDFGNYRPGRYAWQLADPVEFKQPMPAKGSLGLWEYLG